MMFDNVKITANAQKKELTIKVPYSEVIAYTTKANKEVFANLYYVKLNDNYTLNLQLLGKKVIKAVEDKEVKL